MNMMDLGSIILFLSSLNEMHLTKTKLLFLWIKSGGLGGTDSGCFWINQMDCMLLFFFKKKVHLCENPFHNVAGQLEEQSDSLSVKNKYF